MSRMPAHPANTQAAREYQSRVEAPSRGVSAKDLQRMLATQPEFEAFLDQIQKRREQEP